MTVRKLVKIVFTPNLCLVGIVLGVAAFLLATIPAAAHADPAPQNHVNPDGTAVLYVYPQPGPPRQGEEIIEVSHPPFPEDALPKDRFERAKDPRTWA